MRIFKRGSVYWFEYVLDGRRYQKSTRLKSRREAETMAANHRVTVVTEGDDIAERKPAPRFGVAMKDFLAWSVKEHEAHPATARRYRVSSAALLRYFKDIPLDKIRPDEIERFKADRSSQSGKRTGRALRPATINRELACLKAMFNFAIKADVLAKNPVSRVKFLAEQNEQNRVLTFKEQALYLAHATPTLRDVATLMLETGMRPEEVYGLESSNVRLADGFLMVPKGKTPAARRRVNLTAAASAILRERIKAAKGRFLFPCETDEKRPIPKVNNAHDRAVRDSKVAPFRLYDCRHTWATRAAESGIDLVTLASMLGHSRIQMVLRYAHPTQSHQKTAMEKIEQHNASQQMREFGDATLQ